MPVRVPKLYGSVRDPADGSTQGVLLEDLCVPGAVLNPSLDDEGIFLTARHAAKLHAAFWNHPGLISGGNGESLGLRPHNDPDWFQPAWQNALEK